MGRFLFFIYYNIYYKFCPNVQWYGLVITCRCPDKGGVLAPGRDKGGPLRGRITGMGGLGRVRNIYICTYVHLFDPRVANRAEGRRGTDVGHPLQPHSSENLGSLRLAAAVATHYRHISSTLATH